MVAAGSARGALRPYEMGADIAANRHLAGPNVARQCPGTAALAQAFRIEVTRRQRRSDGTVSLAGQRFEIPAQYRQLANVQLRYARWDLRRVDLVDARTGVVLCAVHPLDKSANADGQRRALSQSASGIAAPTPGGIAPLLRQLLADYAATGLPPAYLSDPSLPPLTSPSSSPPTPPTVNLEQDNNP